MALAQAQLLTFEGFAAPAFISSKIQINQKQIQPEKPISKELFENRATLESALNNLFIGSKEENRIQQVRLIMGDAISNFSEEELKSYITEFQSLLDAWLDTFEKQLFENKTIKQLLKEG